MTLAVEQPVKPAALAAAAPRARARRAYHFAVAGAAGALFGLYLYTELTHVGSIWLRDALAGAWIGGSLGFWLSAVEPFADRAWFRLSRMATWGALAGTLGGAIGLILGEWVLGAFQGGLIGRAVSWAILGAGIGAGQGLAHRSAQRLAFGLIGGVLGGFLGGFLFELLRARLGETLGYPVAQALGIVVLGAGIGLALALVEQTLTRARVVVLSGKQEGRMFLLTRKTSTIGLDEQADIGLFADSAIARRHAEIVRSASGYVLANKDAKSRTAVNDAPVHSECALKESDRIRIGNTLLRFHVR